MNECALFQSSLDLFSVQNLLGSGTQSSNYIIGSALRNTEAAPSTDVSLVTQLVGARNIGEEGYALGSDNGQQLEVAVLNVSQSLGSTNSDSIQVATQQSSNGRSSTVVVRNYVELNTSSILQLNQTHVVRSTGTGSTYVDRLSGTGDLEKLSAFREGLFYVQDAAAKLSVLCAQIPEGSRVLDCCAAPGGKSFAAVIGMNGTGSITSCDVHEHKAELIRKGAARLGIENLTAQVRDASIENSEWVGQLDAVIADVPCSGLGIIRKKPDIRYKNLAEMKALPELQLKILQNQANYVRPGGILLYSTCTLVREENEGVVEAFLASRPDYEREPLPLPKPFPENTSGMLALVPGEYDTDGFFICRLRRKA